MRTLLLVSCLLLAPVTHGADSLRIAQQLEQSGAPELALARVVRDQPSQPDAASWYEWESLRLTLLSASGRAADIVERVKQMPKDAPQSSLKKAYGHAAWAHLELGEGSAARAYLGQLLWLFPIGTADHQWGRRLVIRSYLADHKPDDAYRAMLRYQQDFAPLPADVATEFVQGLLAEGRATEAMTWFGSLDPASLIRLRLQLHAGLVSPQAAIAQVRSVSRPLSLDTSAAEIIVDASEKLQDGRLRIEALELMLNGQKSTDERIASALWRAYMPYAEAMGNRAQLLQGDHAAWFAMAAGLASSDAQASRAVYAYLAERAGEGEVRDTALRRLFASHVSGKLDGAAVYLLAAAPWGGEKKASALADRLLAASADAAPREMLMAAGRFVTNAGQHALAADYYARAVLAGNVQRPDAGDTLAFKNAVESMERAGFASDASAFARRVAAMRLPVQPEPAPKPTKSKRRR